MHSLRLPGIPAPPRCTARSLLLTNHNRNKRRCSTSGTANRRCSASLPQPALQTGAAPHLFPNRRCKPALLHIPYNLVTDRHSSSIQHLLPMLKPVLLSRSAIKYITSKLETESFHKKKIRVMNSSQEEVPAKKPPAINNMLEDDSAGAALPAANSPSGQLSAAIQETEETEKIGEATEKNNLRLMSSDGKEVVVEAAVAMKSQLIRQMIEADCAGDSTVINIPNVPAAALSLIFHYCEKHLGDDGGEAINDDLKSFDANFINVDLDTLYDLLLGSNYLDVKGLLDLACQKVADLIKGNSPDEIRRIFNIEKDFTPEEEEELNRENKWAFE